MTERDHPYDSIRRYIDNHSVATRTVAAVVGAGAVAGILRHQHKQKEELAALDLPILVPDFDDDQFAVYAQQLAILDDERLPEATGQAMLSSIAHFNAHRKPASRQQLCQTAARMYDNVEPWVVDEALKYGNKKLFGSMKLAGRKFWLPKECVWFAVHSDQDTDYPKIQEARSLFEAKVTGS